MRSIRIKPELSRRYSTKFEAILSISSHSIFFLFRPNEQEAAAALISSQTMEHVRVLKEINVADIQSYLANCKQEFETSQLYSAQRNEKFTDE